MSWARRKLTGVLVAAASLTSSACDSFALSCNDNAVPALSITVVSEASGDSLPGHLAWVRDGSFVDTLETWDGVASGPFERGGEYEAHVEHAGFEDWIRYDIDVEEDGCGHPETRFLTARMIQEIPE